METVEVVQGLDVLDLLHRQHVEVHGLDAGRQGLALLLGHGLDQPTPELTEPVIALFGELVGDGDVTLFFRQLVDVRFEVEAREQVVEVEGPDLDVHTITTAFALRLPRRRGKGKKKEVITSRRRCQL